MADASSDLISVIILTKNAGSRLDSVLRSVFSNKINCEREVIIIDSGSTDETKDIISRYCARLIEIAPSDFSHGGTRNLGAENARGNILVFLTQDAVPADEHWLFNLTKGLENPEVAGIFGRQLADKDASAIEKFYLLYLYPEYPVIKNSINPGNCLLSNMFFSNVNSAIKKEEWQKCRFDETVIMSEDQAWAKAMLTQGKKIIYEPSAAVVHSHKYNLTELIKRNFESGLSLRGIVNASLKSSIKYELRYLRSGFSFLLKNRFYSSLARFSFYEFIRVLSFILGSHSGFLPLALKKRLCLTRAYWS